MNKDRALARIYEKSRKEHDLTALYNKVKSWGRQEGYTLIKSLCIVFEYFFQFHQVKGILPDKFKKAKIPPKRGASDASESSLG